MVKHVWKVELESAWVQKAVQEGTQRPKFQEWPNRESAGHGLYCSSGSWLSGEDYLTLVYELGCIQCVGCIHVSDLFAKDAK